MRQTRSPSSSPRGLLRGLKEVFVFLAEGVRAVVEFCRGKGGEPVQVEVDDGDLCVPARTDQPTGGAPEAKSGRT